MISGRLSQTVRLITECLAATRPCRRRCPHGSIRRRRHDRRLDRCCLHRDLDRRYHKLLQSARQHGWGGGGDRLRQLPRPGRAGAGDRPGSVAALLVALSAGCAGFLVHNWHPAQIFMGDAGSLFLGFVISSATVMICDTGDFSRDFDLSRGSGMLLMTFVPVVDTCTVMLSRQRAGYRWNQGGKDHIAHRLQAIGLSTTHTAILLSVTAAVTTVLGSSVVIGMLPARGALGAAAAVGAAIVALAQKVEVHRPEVTEGLQSANRDAAVVG